MNRASFALSIALLLPAIAFAEVKQSSADGAIVEHRYQIAATPERAWDVLVHPERWWPADHTWSGDPANLRLIAEAGGCFCENWGMNGVEHGRVVMSLPGKQLRFRGALGPLQELAATGLLKVTLAAKDGGTEAVVTYRLSGDASQRLDTIAPAVDRVIGEQFGSFARLASQTPAKSAP
jgi:uncharacterized protein YndB with AHSA1/START domain